MYKPLADFPRNKRMRDGRHAYCKPCHNARGRETKERLYGGNRHYHLKHRYGISATQVEEMIRDQGGVCPICGKSSPEHVDHDHETDRVRGILCFNCNGGLGQFGDDPDRLLRAQLYLEWADMTLEERTRSDRLARERVEALRGRAA
jgi:hypothetical protein